LVTHSRRHLPTSAEIDGLFAILSSRESATADELLASLPAGRKPFVERALLWLAKYGIVRILPASS
jgi:predicted transcriptional regulator